MNVKKLFVLLVLLLVLPLVLANHSSYYADLSINVLENGYVTFLGDTNYQPFNNIQTTSYTSKEGEYWVLNIDTGSDNFSNYYFEVLLPERAIINYMKASNINIDTSESRIRITGFDEDKPMIIKIQYKIGSRKFITTNNIMIFLLVLLVVFGTFLFRAKIIRNASKSETNVNIEELHFTNDRQKLIYEYVSKNNRITQKTLEKKLDMPKSSLSRNIDSLYKKGYIEKKRVGMSNILKIKKV